MSKYGLSVLSKRSIIVRQKSVLARLRKHYYDHLFRGGGKSTMSAAALKDLSSSSNRIASYILYTPQW